MANSHCQRQHLLHLELDSGLHLINFGHHVLTVGRQGRQLVSLIQAWAQDSWDLLDQRLWSQKGIFLGKLLDQFLVLIEFLQHLNVRVGDIHSLGLITVLLVPQDTYGELGVGSGLKPDGAREAFVLLRVIVLLADPSSPKSSSIYADCCAGLPATPQRECCGRLCCSWFLTLQ